MKSILILQNTILHYRKALYNELSKYYNVTVLHSGKKSVTKDDSYNEIITPVKKIGIFTFQKGVITEIRSDKYDVVISMFDLHWVKNIWSIIYRKKAKIIWWGHRYGNNQILNKIKTKLILFSDGVILYNDSQLKQMLQLGIPENKIFIAENTIFVGNSENLSGLKKSSLLYVGRAQKRKRVDLLITTFASILKDIPSFVTIDIVGIGEENAYLKRLAQKLRVEDRVIFHGEVNDSRQLKELYKKAFAYVSPDAVGLGAQHSFAYGTPVVTTSVGYKGAEYEKLEDTINSLLFKNEEEFKEIIIKIITDNDFRKKIGHNAYQLYSSKLTMQNMAQGFIDAIENTNKSNIDKTKSI